MARKRIDFFGASCHIYRFAHRGYVRITTVRTAEAVTHTVLFLEELIDSRHSFDGPSALVILVGIRVFSCLGHLDITI